MSIHFVCPLGHKLSVPDDRAGQPGRCPVCHQRVFVPERSVDGAEDCKGGSPEITETAGATQVGSHVETREGRPPVSLELEASEPESQPTEVAAQEPRSSTERPIQPPPVRWQNAVAPVASPPPLPQAPVPTSAAPAGPAAPRPASPSPVRWFAWQKSNALEGYAISRPNPRQLEMAYWLASLLPFAAAFCAAPALPHMQFAGAPGWAQWMLFAAVLHMGYAAWLAILPDASTIRVGMYLFAASATAYFAAMMVICFFDAPQLSALGLSGTRWAPAGWCGLVFAVLALTSGACGWMARQWQETV